MISVGLVVYKNEDLLIACLRSFLKFPSGKSFEYLIVNNEKGAALQKAQAFLMAENLRHKIFHNIENNIASARNIVLAHSSRDYVYFTDPDCEQISECTLSFLNHYHSSGEDQIAAVGGANHGPQGRLFHQSLHLLSQSILGHFNSTQTKAAHADIEFVGHLSTSNVLYKKESLLKAGGFNPRLDLVGEDLEMSLRLAKNSKKMVFLRGCEVLHKHEASLLKWARKVFKYGSAQTLILFENASILKTHRLLPLAACFTLGGLFSMGYFWIVAMFFGGYLLLVLANTIYYAVKSASAAVIFFYPAILTTTHFCYSAGQVYGLFKGLKGRIPFG